MAWEINENAVRTICRHNDPGAIVLCIDGKSDLQHVLEITFKNSSVRDKFRFQLQQKASKLNCSVTGSTVIVKFSDHVSNFNAIVTTLESLEHIPASVLDKLRASFNLNRYQALEETTNMLEQRLLLLKALLHEIKTNKAQEPSRQDELSEKILALLPAESTDKIKNENKQFQDYLEQLQECKEARTTAEDAELSRASTVFAQEPLRPISRGETMLTVQDPQQKSMNPAVQRRQLQKQRNLLIPSYQRMTPPILFSEDQRKYHSQSKAAVAAVSASDVVTNASAANIGSPRLANPGRKILQPRAFHPKPAAIQDEASVELCNDPRISRNVSNSPLELEPAAASAPAGTVLSLMVESRSKPVVHNGSY